MAQQHPGIQTYSSAVRVGNWFEELALEEDMLKDFLKKRERGELAIQRNAAESVVESCNVSRSMDGLVHFGDVTMLINPGAQDGSRSALCLVNRCGAGVTVIPDFTPDSNSCFRIMATDGTPDGQPLRYGQPFYLANSYGTSFLSSNRATFTDFSRKARHNTVFGLDRPTHLSEWIVVPLNPQYRFELDGSPVPANQKLLLRHVKTNNALCVEGNVHSKIIEVTTYTKVDAHRFEEDVNYWMMALKVPGDGSMEDIGPMC